MKTPWEYAVDLAASAIDSHAEDDLNEDGEVYDEDHLPACDLAHDIAQWIRDFSDDLYEQVVGK